MTNVAYKTTHIVIPSREPNKVAFANPVSGSHLKKVATAFRIAFTRYEKAFEELAKV